MAEQTREQIAIEALENAINNCGFNPKRFAESTTKWHRNTSRMNYSNWLSGSFGSMVQTSIDMTCVMNMLLLKQKKS